jgi:hypothetical protein
MTVTNENDNLWNCDVHGKHMGNGLFDESRYLEKLDELPDFYNGICYLYSGCFCVCAWVHVVGWQVKCRAK